ncbi:MAG: hypothetical protein JW731_00465 [Bacteroidales bacterium]|nr:hypothetical protein [Bacteroidales bacterium]
MKMFVYIVLLQLVFTACQEAHEMQGNPPKVGQISLECNFEPLETGFLWAKEQALAYVHENDPVGPWFEAALPGREAFCMRDVAHQSMGAMALGLWDHTFNMMHKFALNISDSKDWCSYWEINRFNQPAPVDYRNDRDFWYNLPANFDIIRSCLINYEWTGNKDYLDNHDFMTFYNRSLNDYVRRWDSDGNGWMDSPAENGIRGIPTYWEGRGPKAFTGGDLLAAQFAGNLAFSKMLYFKGQTDEADLYHEKAERLRFQYNSEWWDRGLKRFFTSITQNGDSDTTMISLMQILPLYFGIVETGPEKEELLDNLPEGSNVEDNSYRAEVFYQNDRNQKAFECLMKQLDPNLDRREYPENPFTAIGTIVRYLAGIHSQPVSGRIEIKPRLPEEIDTLYVNDVPVLRNVISVGIIGQNSITLENKSGPEIEWMAVFAGEKNNATIDGSSIDIIFRNIENGRIESCVMCSVKSGEKRTLKVFD